MSEMGDSDRPEAIPEESSTDARAESASETSGGSAEQPAAEPGEIGPAESPAEAGSGEAPDVQDDQPSDSPTSTDTETEAPAEAEPGEGEPTQQPGQAEDSPQENDNAGDSSAEDPENVTDGEQTSEARPELDQLEVTESGTEPDTNAIAGEPGEVDPAEINPAESSIPELGEVNSGTRLVEPGETEPVEAGTDGSTEMNAGQPPEDQPPAETEGARDGSSSADGSQNPPDQNAPRDGSGRPDISRLYPNDYQEADSPAPNVDRPHQSPETWAKDINPGRDDATRKVNCGECARAAQDTWAGNPSVAAAMAPEVEGEKFSRMDEWAGGSPENATLDQVSNRLTELGPGSSAIIRCAWIGGGNHYFNAINDNGTIRAVDAQGSRVGRWPPSREVFSYDGSDMKASYVFYFDSSGKVVR